MLTHVPLVFSEPDPVHRWLHPKSVRSLAGPDRQQLLLFRPAKSPDPLQHVSAGYLINISKYIYCFNRTGNTDFDVQRLIAVLQQHRVRDEMRAESSGRDGTLFQSPSATMRLPLQR